MMGTKRRAVLLDRDGVINRTFVRDGVTYPPRTLKEFEFLPGVLEATKRLADADWLLVVVTNQPDVARGTQTREAIEAMNREVTTFLPVLEVFTCWHDSSAGCECRKPKPGLLLDAARRWGFDLRQSIMVGDRWSDVEAGQAVGCFSILVDNPFGGAERCKPDKSVRDLAEAADWIIRTFSRRDAA